MSKPMTKEQIHCFGTAEAILNGIDGVEFCMTSFRRGCGSAGCIAGYAVALYRPREWFSGGITQADVSIYARQLLGVPVSLADSLFCPWNYNDLAPEADEITPEMAAGVLKNFALTGKVEWPEVDL